ncbi:ABC transporter ATP-binding protein [Chelativorans sp. Marseille-P2723]|uniref:ABC transporter ATP-binding protein n=1 Tax=Chelativorans sp. Marseille-P2723 TaxID=2709133 RepID=UPI00157072C9|nr:ABC transporter ATP-binding protein [Chelativorans sp. Marseille-P2723]
MTKVHLSGVRKSFGSFTAIEHLELTIESGEFVVLLGPSGCGKTTMLRMIAGLEEPSAGSILLDGADVSNTPVQERNVGMVFQRAALFPHMTVEKNILFGLSVRGRPRGEMREKLEEMLEIVQLHDFRHRFPAQLSGGQMQRVAIARTLITEPSVLMMDEPLAGLDTKLRATMRRFIRDVQKRLRLTTIFVTHDQAEAMELADRIAVIFDGRLAQYAPPDLLYKRPSCMAVADFMGVSNIFPGTLVAKNRVESAFGQLRVDEQPRCPLGATVSLMLRAEAIDLHEHKEDTRFQAIEGRIVERDFLGASVVYTLECGATRIAVSEPSRRLLDVGRTVWLDIAPESVWLLSH